jgi:hypothetical protein
VELRDQLARTDLQIVWVMADNQIGLRERVHFAVDPGSASIDDLGIRVPEPEKIAEGVPHPTTYLLDREGRVRFVETTALGAGEERTR